MSTYFVIAEENLMYQFNVEADTEDEAKEKALDMVCVGDVAGDAEGGIYIVSVELEVGAGDTAPQQ